MCSIVKEEQETEEPLSSWAQFWENSRIQIYLRSIMKYVKEKLMITHNVMNSSYSLEGLCRLTERIYIKCLEQCLVPSKCSISVSSSCGWSYYSYYHKYYKLLIINNQVLLLIFKMFTLITSLAQETAFYKCLICWWCWDYIGAGTYIMICNWRLA